MMLVRITMIKSRVKGHHVNNYNYTIGEKLEYKLDAQTKYSSNIIMILEKKDIGLSAVPFLR